ncbi:MAG TPA: TonB-dependent receptor, partial [Gammaproteobacteria bacterium]|nr:TonB-dependent receptor [Gammaproteobacteria bacterium]
MADHPEELPDMAVQGQRLEGFGDYILDPDFYGNAAPDSAGLLRHVPGASFNDNGPISGQPQYRGMYGPRMNVRIDNMYVNSGGPNWMDPPLHYMPSSLLESIEVYRGIAPVSSGSGIGGYIEAKTKSSHFTADKEFSFHGDMSVTGRSVDEGYSVGGLLSLANRNHRLHVLGDRDDGGDLEFGDGEISATEHERDIYGFGYAYRTGNHEAGFDYRHQDTGNTGTPSLPLDIAFFDTNIFRGDYKGQLGKVKIEAGLSYSDIEHQMDNFSLRSPTDFFALNGVAVDPRFVNAGSDSLGYSLKGTMPFGKGDLKLGFDGKLDEHDATVFNPDQASFFVTNFNDATHDEYSFFAETLQKLNERFDLELGVRYTRVETDAGDVDAIVTPGGGIAPPVAMLRDRFNAADRSREDDNVDWVARLDYHASDNLTVELGFARKTRSPYYIERYAWIPLEVNAGLGDGNNYVGNINLDPEVSHQVELGLDWQFDRFYFSPRGFYRRVDDYIQGVPVTDSTIITVGGVNGDATPLQFANVDAELYGADANWGIMLSNRWQLDGVISYVRGKRRDIGDNLYRIAPLNANFSLTHHRATWQATLESVFVARQENIS